MPAPVNNGCHKRLPFRGGKWYYKFTYKSMCKWAKKCQTGGMKGFWHGKQLTWGELLSKKGRVCFSPLLMFSAILPLYLGICYLDMLLLFPALPQVSLSLVFDFWHPFPFHAYACFRQQQLHGINPSCFIDPLFKAVFKSAHTRLQ